MPGWRQPRRPRAAQPRQRPRSATVTMPLTASAGYANGRLIGFDARVSDNSGAALAVVGATRVVGSVGQYLDSDGDSVVDAFDNCTAVANANQLDSDGDGYGNACDADF